MKATPEQIELARKLATYILGIVQTNDLSSPSHWNLNEEAASIMAEDHISFEKKESYELQCKINECFDSALSAIRMIKEK